MRGLEEGIGLAGYDGDYLCALWLQALVVSRLAWVNVWRYV